MPVLYSIFERKTEPGADVLAKNSLKANCELFNGLSETMSFNPRLHCQNYLCFGDFLGGCRQEPSKIGLAVWTGWT